MIKNKNQSGLIAIILKCWKKNTFFLLVLFLASCGNTYSPRNLKNKKYLYDGTNAVSLGNFTRTMYILAWEEEYSDTKDEGYSRIYNRSGQFIGEFPENFLTDVCLQGSGKLITGEILTLEYTGCYGNTTTVGDLSTYRSCYARCFRLLSPDYAPFGLTNNLKPAVPLRTVAVDPQYISLGEKIYLPRWDGYVLPNGKKHDGCFVADDTGGAIKGYRIDIEAGLGHLLYEMLRSDKLIRDNTSEEIMIYPEKCAKVDMTKSPVDGFWDYFDFEWNPSDNSANDDSSIWSDSPSGDCSGMYSVPVENNSSNQFVTWTCHDQEYAYCPPEGTLAYLCHKNSKIKEDSVDWTLSWDQLCLTHPIYSDLSEYSKIKQCDSPRIDGSENPNEDDNNSNKDVRRLLGCYISDSNSFVYFFLLLFLIFLVIKRSKISA